MNKYAALFFFTSETANTQTFDSIDELLLGATARSSVNSVDGAGTIFGIRD
jgi:hypothetical protein